MFNNNPRIGQELLDVPMGEMIEQMAMSIAKAQMALDKNSIEVAEMMGGLKAITKEVRVGDEVHEIVTFNDSRVFFGQEKVSLRQLEALHNTNSDKAYRASLRKSLLDENTEDTVYKKPIIEVTKEDGTTNSIGATELLNETDLIFSDNISKNPDYYYRVGSTFYQFDSSSTYLEVNNINDIIDNKSKDKIAIVPRYRDTEVFIPQRLSMLELGFTPTFYQFVDTIIKVCISIKFTREGSSTKNVKSKVKSVSRGIGINWGRNSFGVTRTKTVTTSQVNATYSQKYSYSAEGSSLLQTKLVPIPPPAILEERIQLQMEIARERNELN